MAFSIGIVVSIIVVIIVVFYVAVFPRIGPHYTSRLICPKCNQSFDYKWVPGGSFTAVRLGPNRYMRCPLCHEWSTFDIASTRIKTAE